MTPVPIDEDVLRRLSAPGDRPTAPARPLAQVRRRADRLRLQRRGASGIAAAVAALTVTAVTVPLPWGGRSLVVVGGDRTQLAPGCATGYADQIPYTAAKDLLYLPAADVAGPITGKIFVRSERSDCPYPRLAATAARVTKGVVTASLFIHGPDAVRLLAPGAKFGDDVVQRTVRAGTRTVHLAVEPAQPQSVMAFWTESDGTTWRVDSQGVDSDRVLAAIAGLRIDSGRLALTSLPADLPERHAYSDDEQQGITVRSISVPFGSPDEQAASRWTLTVSDAGTAELAQDRFQVGVREVTVPGIGTALWMASDAVKGSTTTASLTWRLPDGPTLRVSGRSLTLAQAQRIAATVARTDPDDARLLAAKEGPIPTNT